MARAGRTPSRWLRLRHLAEGAAGRAALAVFARLDLDRASDLGGRIARAVGPWLPVSNRARENLRRAFPHKSRDEIERIVRGMWENLGRVTAEYPHLHEIDLYSGDRVEVAGAEHIDRLRDDGRPGLFFTGHVGNWELTPLGIVQRGLKLTYVYRAANNPIVDRLIREARHDEAVAQMPKGAASARKAVALLGEGGHLGMLIDQKMNDGIPVPFFGREAMTAPALAQFALRFRCPVVPIRSERLEGARFRVTYYPPMEVEDTGERHADIARFTARCTAMIEDWVRARPEQWFWLHRRWPD